MSNGKNSCASNVSNSSKGGEATGSEYWIIILFEPNFKSDYNPISI
jgi:hypothetical protein